MLNWIWNILKQKGKNDIATSDINIDTLQQIMDNVNIVDSTGSMCFTMSGNTHPRPLYKPHHNKRKFNHEAPQLFVDGVETKDIQQGAFGTCYFLAAMAYCASQQPNTILHAISPTSNPDEFLVRLYDEQGQLHTCTVDTYIPFEGGDCACAVSKKPNEMWVSLLEKGFAQLVVGRLGSSPTSPRYELVEGGWSATAMTLLARGRSYYICVTDLVSKMLSTTTMMPEFCMAMIQLKEQGCSFFVAWTEEFAADRTDLVAGHAYSVLSIKLLANIGYVFMLHNPWGQWEWNGRFSDSDNSAESQAAHKEFGVSFQNDGFFLMGAHDFFAHICSLEIHEPHGSSAVRNAVGAGRRIKSWTEVSAAINDARGGARKKPRTNM